MFKSFYIEQNEKNENKMNDNKRKKNVSGSYAFNLWIKYYFRFWIQMWCICCVGGDAAAAAAVAAAALPPSNITNKQKINIREIIFYPVATKIDKFQAQAHTMLIMLCHSHHNLFGVWEKKNNRKIRNFNLKKWFCCRKKKKKEWNLSDRKKESVGNTNAVAGTFSKNATVKRWFPVSSFCDLCDC